MKTYTELVPQNFNEEGWGLIFDLEDTPMSDGKGVGCLNPLHKSAYHPNISKHIICTVLYKFPILKGFN